MSDIERCGPPSFGAPTRLFPWTSGVWMGISLDWHAFCGGKEIEEGISLDWHAFCGGKEIEEGLWLTYRSWFAGLLICSLDIAEDKFPCESVALSFYKQQNCLQRVFSSPWQR